MIEVDKKISISLLKALDVGLEYFEKYIKEELKQDEAFFAFGHAVHCYFLERDRFNFEYAIVNEDENKTGSAQQRAFADYMVANKYSEDTIIEAYKISYKTKDTDTREALLKKAKELYISLHSLIRFEVENKEKTKISVKDFERIRDFERAINAHKGLSYLLIPQKDREEYSELLIEFNFQGEECKAIIDKLVIDRVKNTIYILELKTHSVKSIWSNLKRSFKESLYDNHYDKQIAFYKVAVEKFTENREDLKGFEIKPFFVVFQKNYFHVVKLFTISAESIFEALQCVLEWIDTFKMSKKNKFNYSNEYFINELGEEKL